jgi:hypothetical protein
MATMVANEDWDAHVSELNGINVVAYEQRKIGWAISMPGMFCVADQPMGISASIRRPAREGDICERCWMKWGVVIGVEICGC